VRSAVRLRSLRQNTVTGGEQHLSGVNQYVGSLISEEREREREREVRFTPEQRVSSLAVSSVAVKVAV